ncbi:hypothetical protein Dda_6085 [Drechslerella dactyloides]|uniref:C2H2-type domain-containing protein n=1 Tax=Drechslerella dactyloides TaxID=74499 RepID=A0AAD6IVM1_DREDA|nr:hypothetical protein Dda_6085 [Drechslerella dactyloides]
MVTLKAAVFREFVAHPPRIHHPISIPPASAAVPIKSSHRSHHAPHSLGTTNTTHRVTRRKSMSSSAVSHAAAVAAIKEVAANGSLDPTPASSDLKHEPAFAKIEDLQAEAISDYPSPPSSLPTPGVSALSTGFRKSSFGTALKDPVLENTTGEEAEHGAVAVRKGRRSSDGPEEGHSAKGELKCEHCGKGYKHSSCLTKHLWEHTPEWSYTSKLLISKHQQVQLLEAASILVSMKPNTPPASASSTASYSMMDGSSHDSTSEDSPPPMPERTSSPQLAGRSRALSSAGQPTRRHGSHSRAAAPYSRSYQHPPMGSSFGGKITPVASPASMRPTQALSSGLLSPRSVSGQQDDESLAAAVQMLSCSFSGTPVLGPTKPALKTGNVPSLPLSSPPNDFRGLGSPRTLTADYITSNPVAQESDIRGTAAKASNSDENEDVDMDMDDSDNDYHTGRLLRSSHYSGRFGGPNFVVLDNDEKYKPNSATGMKSSPRHDDDEDGVFGKMEE